MTKQHLHDLHETKRLYQASMKGSASWEYRKHCLDKISIINKKIEDWRKEREKKVAA